MIKTALVTHPREYRGELRARLSKLLASCIAVSGIVFGPVGCDRNEEAQSETTAASSDSLPSAEKQTKTKRIKDLGAGTQPARASAAMNPSGWPPVEFEPAVMDFGILGPGQVAQGTVKIWNVGEEPLRILTSRTSCGCTVTDDLGGRVIPPGSFTEFITAMDPKSGLGPKQESLRMIFKDYEWVVVDYSFRAELALPVRVSPPFLAASTRDDSGGWTQTASGTVDLSSIDGSPFSILRAYHDDPQYVDFNPATDEPRNTYTIKWNLDQFAGGPIPWFWVIETDHPDAPVVDVRIRHSSAMPAQVPTRPWQPKDQRVLVDFIRNGESFEITTKHEYAPNRAPQPQTARVQSLSQLLDVQLISAQPTGQILEFRLRITPRDAPSGLLYEKISVGSAGHMVQLRIIGRLVE